jgi:predicted CoA-binding protein
VNPQLVGQILWDEPIRERVTDLAEPIDIVDVFRRPEYTPAIADEAVRSKAKALWLQSGIVSDEAARRASAGGLVVVMDACIGVLHSLLGVPKKTPHV